MPEEDLYEFPEFKKKKKRRTSREVEIDKMMGALQTRQDNIERLQAHINERTSELKPTQDLAVIQMNAMVKDAAKLRKAVAKRAKELGFTFDDEIIEEFRLPVVNGSVKIVNTWKGEHLSIQAELKRKEFRKHVMRTFAHNHPAKEGKLLDYYAKALDVTKPTLKNYIWHMKHDTKFLKKFIKLAGEKRSMSRFAQTDFDKGRKVSYPFDEHSAVNTENRREAIYSHVMTTSLKKHPAKNGKLHEYYADEHNVSTKTIKNDVDRLNKRSDFKEKFEKLISLYVE